MKYDAFYGRLEVAAAKKLWPDFLRGRKLEQLRFMVRKYKFSVVRSDLQVLNGNWYVTHAALLGLAQRRRCRGVHTEAVRQFCEPKSSRWIFKAVVYKSQSCKGFVGYGDADPSNVSPLVRGAEMRVAETRAVNRALRKAYGIGICSVEEMALVAPVIERQPVQLPNSSGNGDGPKVRDRLCQIIRKHNLDPVLVKSYAADFCSVKTLREATRDQVVNFVQNLAEWAEKDRNALLCQLNSYSYPSPEVAR